MKQQILYNPVKTWMQKRGFDATITGSKTDFVIPTSELIQMPYKIPDLVGVNRGNRVAIIEGENN